MDFYLILSKIMKDKDISIPDVARATGLSDSTLRSIITRKSKSVALDVAFKIANGLNIDLETLNGDYANEHLKEISAEALEIARKYDKLDAHGKEIVDTVLNIEYKRVTTVKKITPSIIKVDFENTIEKPYLDGSASAGCGEYISDCECSEYISVAKTELTERADFIVRVNGESMEPDFYDGDRVLVKCQPYVEIGEIGIFIVDNERFIKKQGKGRLVSVNKEYDDVVPGEFTEVRCIGKVIGKL